MAFNIDGIVIDRVQMAIAEDFEGNPQYTLTQLADATVEITAESKDAKDATGTLIKRFWQGKTGTFSANNAIIDFNILGQAAGSGKEIATAEKKITMPGIKTVKAGTLTVSLPGVVSGTVHVNAIANNGTMGKPYTLGTASATQFSLADETLTLPTDKDATKYVVRYDRAVSDGVAIKNRADKFPDTVVLILKCLAIDPCTADTVRSCYIKLPSFQVSPETSLQLTTESQLEYKGDLQVGYCANEKTLYEIYMANEEEDED